jgi:hypothetical protein
LLLKGRHHSGIIPPLQAARRVGPCNALTRL